MLIDLDEICYMNSLRNQDYQSLYRFGNYFIIITLKLKILFKLCVVADLKPNSNTISTFCICY